MGGWLVVWCLVAWCLVGLSTQALGTQTPDTFLSFIQQKTLRPEFRPQG